MAAITGQGLGRKTIGYDLANARHVEEGWAGDEEDSGRRSPCPAMMTPGAAST